MATAPIAPRRESPILVEFVHHEDRYTYLDSGTPVERKPLRPSEVWVDYDNIPATPPAPSPFPGTAGPFTVGILAEPLAGMPGDPLGFQTTPPNRLSTVVPGNLQAAAYRPTLRDAGGRVVPYDPSVWVVDGVEHVVQFKYRGPAELGYRLPLSITYWSYTGAIAGASVGLLSLANEGGGPGLVFDATVAGTAFLRTLAADPAAGLEGIAVSTPGVPGNVVLFGNTMTGANVGAGPGVLFSAKTAAGVLQFHSLAGTANGLTVSAPMGGTITIDNALTGANLGLGAQIFAAKAGALLNLRSLVAAAGSGLTLTQGANDITIDAAAGAVITALANEGAGTGLIFDAIVGNTANLRSLLADPTAGNGGIAVSTVGSEVRVGNPLTAANLGAGAQIFSAKVGASLNLRSLIAAAGSGLALAQNANDITIDAAAGAVVTALANEGVGTGLIFDAIVGNTANLRSLLIDPTAGNGGIAVSTVGTEVRVGNTMTGANVGAGTGTIFSAKTAAGVLQLNSLAGTVNGLTVSAPAAGTVTIDNTLTGANLGAGAQIFSAKVAAALNLRSLVAAAGSGLALTQNANDITIDAAVGAVITALANEGVGTGLIFDAIVGNTANLRSLLIDPTAGNGGIALSTAGSEVRVGNTMTGANVGAGTGTVFAAKTAAGVLQLNSLAGTANGLTVSAPAANVITIDNTLTGANLGAGAQVFSAKVGAALNLRSLVAGANVTVTQNANDITIAATGGGGSSYTRTVVNVAAYAILPADDILAVIYTPTGSPTLTLPLIAGLGGPKRYSIVDEGGAAYFHPITVAAAGGNTIIGGPSVRIENNYNSINLYHNGTTGWFIA